MNDSLAEYLRMSRASTQTEVDANARKWACFDLTPAERFDNLTNRTFYGEAEH